MLTDLGLTELRQYRPEVAEPGDFDEFWAGRLAAARAYAAEPAFVPADTPVRHAEVFDVTFPGYGGDPVRGWLLVPRELAPDPVMVVQFVGYGGGRGNPFDWLKWSAAGYPHLVMDTRGQGGGWAGGDTPDLGDTGAPAAKGFMTRGIADPHGYYYTRLFIDIAAVLPEVPLLAHFRRAADITDAYPYAELADYGRVYPERVEQMFATLSYVDVVNHARRSSAPALFSAGDAITPPSTVFAAFHHYAGPKDIAVTGALSPVAIAAMKRAGTKIVVTAGLLLMSAGFVVAAGTAVSAAYWGRIVIAMVLMAAGLALTSSPATEAIMGALPRDKAGAGSAVNDTTRELGGTLGVAIVGSAMSSIYASHVVSALARLGAPAAATAAAKGSVVAGLGVAAQFPPDLRAAAAAATRLAFMDGLHAGSFVAAAATAAAALATLVFLPARARPAAAEPAAAPAAPAERDLARRR